MSGNLFFNIRTFALHMVDRIKGIGELVKTALETKQGTFTLGFMIALLVGGLATYLMYEQRAEYKTDATTYKTELLECQKNSTAIEIDAQKGCIENAQKQIEAIMQVSEVLKGQSENQKTYIEQRKKRMAENKKFIKEIERVTNENN